MEFGASGRFGAGGSSVRTSGGASQLNRRELRELSKSSARRGGCGDAFGAAAAPTLKHIYPSPLQFYDEPPRNQIALEQFERLALDRLQLLRTFEKHASMSAAKYSKDWQENIAADLKKNGLDYFDAVFQRKGSDAFAFNRQRDHFSHFILRLAYCRTEELRRWFIAQELDFFRHRCASVGAEEIKDFLSLNELQFVTLDEQEKDIIGEELSATLFAGPALATVKSTNFYKVHFSEALDLVRNRRVFLKGGFCYVPETEMVSLIAWMFKSLLTQNLALTAKTLPNLDEDERLVKMLSELDKRYVGDDYAMSAAADAVTPKMIAPLAQKSFPMCMRTMQHHLESEHHLKYKARLQYGLFLKGIGLSLEDAIKFFRGEFAKSHVDPDKFDKEYTYGIRYNYGKEGKKVNFSPWSCMRIIMENVGPGENHGCPFRHHDPDQLRARLLHGGVEGAQLAEVMTAAKEGHYQRACACQFAATHNAQELSTGIINHPNQYYQESTKGPSESNQTTGKLHNVKTEKGYIYSKTAEN